MTLAGAACEGLGKLAEGFGVDVEAGTLQGLVDGWLTGEDELAKVVELGLTAGLAGTLEGAEKISF